MNMPLGWIEPIHRTRAQHIADADARLKMPRQFRLTGSAPDPGPYVNLMELWKHPQVVSALGFEYSGTHQLTGSCFVAGTAVRMADGTEKPIEKIEVGDEVFAHTGAKRKVVRTFKRDYTGTLHTFNVKGWRFPVTMTSDHDCLVVTGKESENWRYTFGGFRKAKAADVREGQRFLLPNLGEGEFKTLDLLALCPEFEPVGVSSVKCSWHHWSWTHDRFVDLNEKLAWILGLYLAEGSWRHNRLFFHLNTTTKMVVAEQLEQYLRDLFGNDINIKRIVVKESSLCVVVHHGILAKLIGALIPDNTYTKRLPGAVLTSPKAVRLAALRGWLDGDGHFEHGPGRGVSIRGVTASEGLARDMGQLALACGLRPSVLRRKRAKHQRVASLDIYINGQDALSVYPERSAEVLAAVKPRPRLMEKTPYGFASIIEKIETEEVVNHPVYCCEVEEEHSLVVNGLAQHQCVGAGGGNVQFTLGAIEVIRLNDPEQIVLPFWLFTYGISRMLLGETSEGEGSLGSTFAEAAKTYGVFSNAENGLPQPQNTDGLIWGESVEMKWSNGKAIASNWLTLGKKHLIRTTTPLKSSAEVRDAIRNLYPVTFASNNYMTPGNERVQGSGADACCVGSLSSNGGHQTSLQAVWDHPTLGLLFWNQNQWGQKTYAADPKTGRRDGCWMTAKDVDNAIRSLDAEVFAFSQFDGYPAQTLKLSSIYDY